MINLDEVAIMGLFIMPQLITILNSLVTVHSYNVGNALPCRPQRHG